MTYPRSFLMSNLVSWLVFDSNELHLVLLSCGRPGNLGVAVPGTGEKIPIEVSAADLSILVQFYTNVTCQQPVDSDWLDAQIWFFVEFWIFSKLHPCNSNANDDVLQNWLQNFQLNHHCSEIKQFKFCTWPVPKNSTHVPQLLKLLEILETRDRKLSLTLLLG